MNTLNISKNMSARSGEVYDENASAAPACTRMISRASCGERARPIPHSAAIKK